MSRLIFALSALALLACKAKPTARAQPTLDATDGASVSASAAASASAHETLPASAAMAEAPVYDLSMKLVDQNGKNSGLDVYRGHPVIISMFYASCPYACPTLISDIKRLEASLDAKARDQVRILLVTFDPERDTSDALNALAKEHKLDTARYKLARAPESQVRELAAVLGIRYRKLDSGAFNHSSVITVLDAKGQVRAHADGLNQPLEALKKTLNDLLGA
jgi:protein SCO1/2